MSQVETVRGPIDVNALGRVLMHEHVFTIGTEIRENWPNYPDPWDEEQRVADAIAKLREIKSHGFDSIVDPTVVGLGRSIARIKRINAEVDLNIVVATGLYTYNDLPMQFHFTGPGLIFDVPEPMVDLFVGDIRDGIAGTGVKAGLLKCCIDEPGATPGVTRVIRAISEAHLQTGVPIMIHTHAHSRSGLVAQNLFREFGVDLSNVLIAHCGDTPDLDYLHEIAAGGSMLGMDRFGIDVFLPFEQRVDTVAKLISEGYVEQMVLSHDASCYSDFYPEAVIHAALPKWGYTHIPDDVLPGLRHRGITEAQIDTMLVTNPRRFFSASKTSAR